MGLLDTEVTLPIAYRVCSAKRWRENPIKTAISSVQRLLGKDPPFAVERAISFATAGLRPALSRKARYTGPSTA